MIALAAIMFGCAPPAARTGSAHVLAMGMPAAAAQQAAPAAQVSSNTPIRDRLQAVISQLNLTKEQTDKIKNLLEQQKQPSSEVIQQRSEALEKLLSEEKVDVKKLAEHFDQDEDQIHNRLANMTGIVIGIREILTPDQRAKLASIPPPDADERRADIVAALKLTPQQQQALEALRPTGADRMLRQAVRDFIQNGDKAALAKAVAESADRLPSPETMATALAGLSLEQRQKLLDLVADRTDSADDQQAGDKQSMAQQPKP